MFVIDGRPPGLSWPDIGSVLIHCTFVKSLLFCVPTTRGTRASNVTDEVWLSEDGLDRGLRVRSVCAVSHWPISVGGRPSRIQSTTEMLRRLDGRSYFAFWVGIAADSSVTNSFCDRSHGYGWSNRFIWVCYAASLNVINGFSVRCLWVRKETEASRLLHDYECSYLCMCCFSAVSRLFVSRLDISAFVSSASGVSYFAVAKVTDFFVLEA